MNYPLVGLCGYAQSGKDSVANILVGQGWKRLAFADKLRDCLYALDPLIPFEADHVRLRWLIDAIGWDDAKVKYPEVRALLQRLGTEVGRKHIAGDLWVNLVEQQIYKADKPVVVTDCRFPNEVAMIRKRAGALIWVHRPEIGPANAHTSEHSIRQEDCDQILANDSDLDWLRLQVLYEIHFPTAGIPNDVAQ